MPVQRYPLRDISGPHDILCSSERVGLIRTGILREDGFATDRRVVCVTINVRLAFERELGSFREE